MSCSKRIFYMLNIFFLNTCWIGILYEITGTNFLTSWNLQRPIFHLESWPPVCIVSDVPYSEGIGSLWEGMWRACSHHTYIFDSSQRCFCCRRCKPFWIIKKINYIIYIVKPLLASDHLSKSHIKQPLFNQVGWDRFLFLKVI